MEAYTQSCDVNGCAHVMLKVGQPEVLFTLCKARIIHESKFFKAAFEGDKFKEGNKFVMQLKEEDAANFKCFIDTMFADKQEDFNPLNSEDLTNLLRCSDQYDAYGCPAIIFRIIQSMQKMCHDYSADPSPANQKLIKDMLIAASKYNVAIEHLAVLSKYAASIVDVFKLQGEVKIDILVPHTVFTDGVPDHKGKNGRTALS